MCWFAIGVVCAVFCASRPLDERIAAAVIERLDAMALACRPQLASCPTPTAATVCSACTTLPRRLILGAGALVFPRIARTSERACRGSVFFGCVLVSVALVCFLRPPSVEHDADWLQSRVSSDNYDNFANTNWRSHHNTPVARVLGAFYLRPHNEAAFTLEADAESVRFWMCTWWHVALAIIALLYPRYARSAVTVAWPHRGTPGQRTV